MKKQLFLVGMFSLIVLGFASCNKDDVAPQDQGTGKVTIGFLGFDQVKTKAGIEDVKRPSTSWNTSVKDLMILFVSNDKVVDARSITLPTGTDMTPKSLTFEQVPAMTGGDIYIVANSGQSTNIARPNDSGGTWSPLTAKNQTFSKMYMKLVASTETDELTGDTKYNQPAEIFMAHQANVNIKADETTKIDAPLELTRIVSLIRVRLNPIDNNKNLLTYNDEKCFVALRKVNPAFYLLNAVSSGHTAENNPAIFCGGAFLDTDDVSYIGATPIVDANYVWYQDFRSFPGGGKPSADKFEIVIKALAKEGYIYPDGTNAKPNAPVYFTGVFEYTATANSILQLNVTVNSQGTATPPTPGSKYGQLNINVELKDWGSVATGDITV